MMQHPVVLDVLSHMHHTFFQSFSKNLSVEVLINSLALRHNLKMDNLMAIERGNQHAFDLRLAHFCFFRPWRDGSVPFHALVLGFRIVLKDPRIDTSKNMYHEIGNYFQSIAKCQDTFTSSCRFVPARGSFEPHRGNFSHPQFIC